MMEVHNACGIHRRRQVSVSCRDRSACPPGTRLPASNGFWSVHREKPSSDLTAAGPAEMIELEALPFEPTVLSQANLRAPFALVYRTTEARRVQAFRVRESQHWAGDTGPLCVAKLKCATCPAPVYCPSTASHRLNQLVLRTAGRLRRENYGLLSRARRPPVCRFSSPACSIGARVRPVFV